MLTEEDDALQVLEEGALVLLLFLPGQLLGDHAAVTQPGPQPAGRGGMARGRSERGGWDTPPPGPALPFPTVLPTLWAQHTTGY